MADNKEYNYLNLQKLHSCDLVQIPVLFGDHIAPVATSIYFENWFRRENSAEMFRSSENFDARCAPCMNNATYRTPPQEKRPLLLTLPSPKLWSIEIVGQTWRTSLFAPQLLTSYCVNQTTQVNSYPFQVRMYLKQYVPLSPLGESLLLFQKSFGGIVRSFTSRKFS